MTTCLSHIRTLYACIIEELCFSAAVVFLYADITSTQFPFSYWYFHWHLSAIITGSIVTADRD